MFPGDEAASVRPQLLLATAPACFPGRRGCVQAQASQGPIGKLKVVRPWGPA